MRKKLLENKAANNFARPAAAGATSPTHRAQPPGGDIDVVCRRGVSVLEGLRRLAPPGTDIRHTPGCALTGDDLSGIPEAVAAAAGSDGR